MKLLLTTTAYPPSVGGAQQHTHELAKLLQERGHELKVITFWDKNRTDWLLGTTLRTPQQNSCYVFEEVEVERIGFSLYEKLKLFPAVLFYYLSMDRCIHRIANVIQPKLWEFSHDIDLVHNIRIGREGLSYASFELSRRKTIPFIFTPNHHPKWIGYPYNAYLNLYRKADGIIVLTNAEKEILVNIGVDEEKIFVTGIGPILAPEPNPDRFALKYQITDPFVLFLGQHYLYKGFKQILEATKIVWQRFPEVNFVFIGPQTAQSNRIFKQYQDDRIHQLGVVDLKTKTDALSACSLLCVPSTQESFGGVYLEAWSMAKPVIGCDIPAVSEVILNGVDGLLVRQQPSDIAEKICFLLDNPRKAKEMGKAGMMKLKLRYNWDKIAELTENAYRQVLSQ